MRLLVTGGCGYVGSHFVWAAHEAGHQITILDDLSGAGKAPPLPEGVRLIIGDIADAHRLSVALSIAPEAVVHFAGKLRVDESVRDPKLYFDTNFTRSLYVLNAAIKRGVRVFVTSSTCAVYGPSDAPLLETARKDPISAYGYSKLAFEHALRSYGDAYALRWAALRYFNAAGAHRDGFLYEGHEPQTHLLPLAIDAALGKRPPLTVFGRDYKTPDGTAVRDYVHVEDIARAHLLMLERIVNGSGGLIGAVNLGTGIGKSVLDVFAAVESVVGAPVPHSFGFRRSGDAASLVAVPTRAGQLGWTPERSDMRTIVEDAVRSRTRAR